MGKKSKTRRILEVAQFENVLEYTDFEERVKPAGLWNQQIFDIPHPITLELACGKGEYTLELARRFPKRNFIGIDIKGPRLWRGAKTALKEQLDNVRFLRIFIDHLDEYFGTDEVNEIWIPFPDPYIRKKSKRSKRLTSSKFLDIYRKVLNPGGLIHLKTDSPILYQFTLDTIREQGCILKENIFDIYQNEQTNELLNIQTFYEKKHLEEGKTIYYIAFQLND